MVKSGKMRCGLLIIIVLFAAIPAFSQDDDQKVIQFSGVVVEMDSTIGIPGVHVYVPGKRRGTSANIFGYFSFPALVGDTVVFSAIGYHRRMFVIPPTDRDMMTVILPMEQDTIVLEELPITAYPTEELFKEAVLTLRPTEEETFMAAERNLDPVLLAQMFREMPMDGSMNHKYFMRMQSEYMFDAYGPRPNQLLNPFAWAEFFKSLKKK